MLAINFVAVLGIAAMVSGWFFMRRYLQVSGKGVETAQDKRDAGLWFAVLFAAALLLRFILAGKYKGNETDMNCFIAWADMVYGDGIKAFYTADAFTDYPPGYMYILWVIGAIRDLFGIAWDSTASIVLTKTPAILSDMATGALLYHVGKRYLQGKGAVILSALYLLCPAVILDSAVWGQTDAVFTLLIVLMCYLVTEKKLIPAYFVFAVGILIKPQSLIFTPVLIFGIVDQVFLEDFNWKKFWVNLGLGIAAILLIGVLMLPFGFQEALAQYTDTLGSYEYASVNAYNLWTAFGQNWASQDNVFIGLSCQSWGTVFIVLTVIAAAVFHFRSRKNPSGYYFAGAFIVTSVFMTSVRMHERYIFPVMILLLLAYAMRPKRQLMFLYIALSALTFYNVAHVLWVYDLYNFDPMEPVPLMIAWGMLAAFGYMIYIAVAQYGKGISEKEAMQDLLQEEQMGKNNKGKRTGTKRPAGKSAGSRGRKTFITPSAEAVKWVKADIIALGIIMLIYGVVAFVRLGNMSAPETGYSVVKEGTVLLDMGKETQVAKMWDYLGYQNNPQYNIEYTNDPQTGWTNLNEDGSTWDAGSVFCWNSVDINVQARYFRITPSVDNVEDSIMELVLTDAEGNLLQPVNANGYQALFDEQDMFEGRASAMNGTYFDEIYHARTAYEMVHNLYCYENTHPPLGKVFIACGVLMFGMNPFGWRFMGTLFGVLMLPVIYLFAKKFFKETWISIVTTLLFAFDFMHFVQTRIATIDVFVTLFIMLSYYLMYSYSRMSFYDTPLKKTFLPLGLCGVAMGLSWACKWTGIYSSVGLCIIFFAQMIKRYREFCYAERNPNGTTAGISHRYIRDNFYTLFWKTIGFCCVFFVLVPVVIYLLSYIPFSDGTDRGFFEKVIEAQRTMFDYHSNLNATHPYSSTWYQWPIIYRPIWYYSGEISSTLREGISAFGNPLVWWAGIPAACYMLYLIFAKKDRKAGFLMVGYLSQYAPWFLVTRVVFIYHYFPSVPFVTMMLGYSFYNLVQWRPKWKKAVYVYVALAVGLFALFYPVLSGLAIHPDYAEKWLKWFDTWVLLQTW